jgi:tetratricopeptide (TPR) repeat protein
MEEACAAANHACTLGDLKPHDYVALVGVYLRASRPDEAKNVATEYAETWPQNYRSHKLLLRVLLNTRQSAAAIDLLSRIRTLPNRPESAFPEITLTKLLIEQGRLAEARHYYDLAKSIDPDDKELAALATLVDQPVQSTAA